MKVGSCGVLDLSRVYPKTPFEPMFYSWWNCPLSIVLLQTPIQQPTERVHTHEARDTRFYRYMIIIKHFKCETDELKGYWCGNVVSTEISN